MKKIGFLTKLHKEGKLQLVSPSDAIKESYLSKSESNLISAKILLDNQRLEEAVGLAYYSMYNMLTALLFQVGIKCENHTAAILLLKSVFDLEDRDISFVRKERIDKQYYVDFNITRDDAQYVIETAEDYNRCLFDFIAKMNSEKIRCYREQFLSLI
ncbi:MAG: HEPN domain-containing protein [Candidatus Bathyarchaeota archaeon]|nr:HEPN domain-containing protein [Candidatus Bathyarchaeota archaeon]